MSLHISDDTTPGNPFWRFSIEIYGRDAVKNACLALQDKAGGDVNLILFLCWRAGQHLAPPTGDDLSAMISALDPVNSEVIHPLRQVRRRLASLPRARSGTLRDLVLKAELEGERMAQDLLYQQFGAPGDTTSLSPPVAARQALLSYVQRLAGSSAPGQDTEGLVRELTEAVFGNESTA